MKSYEEQRLERLSEAIFDYIQDENASASDLGSSEEDSINFNVQANSPYNDGWTQQFYKDRLKDDVNVGSVSTASSYDWNDFWGDDHIRLTDC